MDPFTTYLQELADLKRPCTIRFRNVDGGVSEVRAHIISVESVAHREMIETDAGIHIGVDQIVSVNDRQRADYC
jgi:hypothetical protein